MPSRNWFLVFLLNVCYRLFSVLKSMWKAKVLYWAISNICNSSSGQRNELCASPHDPLSQLLFPFRSRLNCPPLTHTTSVKSRFLLRLCYSRIFFGVLFSNMLGFFALNFILSCYYIFISGYSYFLFCTKHCDCLSVKSATL